MSTPVRLKTQCDSMKQPQAAAVVGARAKWEARPSARSRSGWGVWTYLLLAVAACACAMAGMIFTSWSRGNVEQQLRLMISEQQLLHHSEIQGMKDAHRGMISEQQLLHNGTIQKMRDAHMEIHKREVEVDCTHTQIHKALTGSLGALQSGAEQALSQQVLIEELKTKVEQLTAVTKMLPRKVIDITIYNGEPAALTRLELLYPAVDRFYIVESWLKFAGQRKSALYKDIHSATFAPFADKITWIVYDELGSPNNDTFKSPVHGSAWGREEAIRNYPRHVVQADLERAQSWANCTTRKCLDDWVDPEMSPSQSPYLLGGEFVAIVGDVDELPEPNVLTAYRGDRNKYDALTKPKRLSMSSFYYNFECWVQTWDRAVLVRGDQLFTKTLHKFRPPDKEGGDGDEGWHLSYGMSIQGIVQKIQGFSHQELNKPPYNDEAYIRKQIKEGNHLFPDHGGKPCTKRKTAYLPKVLQKVHLEILKAQAEGDENATQTYRRKAVEFLSKANGLVGIPKAGSDGFAACSDETFTCLCNGLVRFGVEGRWSPVLNVNGEIGCDQPKFGADPAPNMRKSCQCQSTENVQNSAQVKAVQPTHIPHMVQGIDLNAPTPLAFARNLINPASRKFAFMFSCARGTGVAGVDYAKAMRQYIPELQPPIFICVSKDGTPFDPKFEENMKHIFGRESVFQALEPGHREGWWPPNTVDAFVKAHNVTDLYLLKSGAKNPPTETTLKGVRNLVHCVFDARQRHGDVFARVSDEVPAVGDVSTVPHMVAQLGPIDGPDLRHTLNIKTSSTVFCRYGGPGTFDIGFSRQAVDVVSKSNSEIYFLFMSTDEFCCKDRPNVIYLPSVATDDDKAQFIRTCDAMLHARQGGETFGLAVAEFSMMNKPVLTFSGSSAKTHLVILGSKALPYANQQDLERLLITFNKSQAHTKDWKAYSHYSPLSVLHRFLDVFWGSMQHMDPPSVQPL